MKAKFELRMFDDDPDRTKPLLTLTFDELRLSRSKTIREQWLLTREGIALIEKALEQKKQLRLWDVQTHGNSSHPVPRGEKLNKLNPCLSLLNPCLSLQQNERRIAF